MNTTGASTEHGFHSLPYSLQNRQYEFPLSTAISLSLVGNMFIECMDSEIPPPPASRNLFLSTLPSVPAVHAEHEHGHRLVGAPRLFLRTRRFDALAPSACKQRCLQQIPLDPAHVINLLFVRPLPIQSDIANPGVEKSGVIFQYLALDKQYTQIGGCYPGGGGGEGTHLRESCNFLRVSSCSFDFSSVWSSPADMRGSRLGEIWPSMTRSRRGPFFLRLKTRSRTLSV